MTNKHTLDYTQEAFREEPSDETATRYLVAACHYMRDDMIGDDEFFDIVAEIDGYLNKEETAADAIERLAELGR